MPWEHCKGPSYHHILKAIDLGCPVWNVPHSTLPVAELLTEGSILGLGVPTAVRVMESHVEEEGPECSEGDQSRRGHCLNYESPNS